MIEKIEKIRNILLKDKSRKMSPPLREEEIVEFEQQYKIRLPEDYRLFLQTIGNGDQHKYEPLEPLGKGVPVFPYKNLEKPFPFTNVTYWVENDTFFSKSKNGVLYLMGLGGEDYWLLVVTGEARGEMWFRGSDLIQPCSPRMGFLSWYETMITYGLDSEKYWGNELLEKEQYQKVIEQVYRALTNPDYKRRAAQTFTQISYVMDDEDLKQELYFFPKLQNKQEFILSNEKLQMILEKTKKLLARIQ